VVRVDGPGDPRVGVVGGSYGGALALLLAGQDPRVDAIVPLITWNDLSYSLASDNSGLPQGTARSGSVSSSGTGVFKYQWASLFTTVGVGDGAADAAALLDPANAENLRNNCGNFEPEVCQALAEVSTLG
jgi:ABC-2 type transport system ATP-binding protein